MCPWGADPKSQTAALGFALTGLERVLFLLLHCLQLMSNKTLRGVTSSLLAANSEQFWPLPPPSLSVS